MSVRDPRVDPAPGDLLAKDGGVLMVDRVTELQVLAFGGAEGAFARGGVGFDRSEWMEVCEGAEVRAMGVPGLIEWGTRS